MEEKSVDITIQSLQRRPEGTETLTQRVTGTFCRETAGWRIRYREGENSGLGDTLTTFRLEEGRAVLERTGEVTTRMVFQVGEATSCRYATAYGELPMTIETLGLDWELGEAGGRAHLRYTIQIDGADVGETRLRLTVKTKENGYDR